MGLGKAIEIYLPEGNSQGIKICDINTSFVKGVLIPRNKLGDLPIEEDLTVQGIYFLLTEVEETSTFKVYVGEAENLHERLKNHDKNKPHWNKAVLFLSSKLNLNKAHFKFLENHCYHFIKNADRFKLENQNIPSKSNLTPSNRDLALHFFGDLKVIIGTLGFPLFEEIKIAKEENIFYCTNKSASAKGSLTDEGFVVYSGSISNLEEQPSAANLAIHRLRERLIDEGILKEENGVLKFTKDFMFGSPSTAAAVVVGGNSNGWEAWKNKEGKSLDEIKRYNISLAERTREALSEIPIDLRQSHTEHQLS